MADCTSNLRARIQKIKLIALKSNSSVGVGSFEGVAAQGTEARLRKQSSITSIIETAALTVAYLVPTVGFTEVIGWFACQRSTTRTWPDALRHCDRRYQGSRMACCSVFQAVSRMAKLFLPAAANETVLPVSQ